MTGVRDLSFSNEKTTFQVGWRLVTNFLLAVDFILLTYNNLFVICLKITVTILMAINNAVKK